MESSKRKESDKQEAKAPTHEATGNRPIWTCTLNRVHASVWKHDHDGQSRYSVAIFREWFSKRENKTKRDYYFDYTDLDDVRAVAHSAQEKVLELMGYPAEERVGIEVD